MIKYESLLSNIEQDNDDVDSTKILELQNVNKILQVSKIWCHY